MITIDGSLGEGGGQILRTAVGLSLVTGQPFRMEKIRAERSRPGLLRQHLTAVEAAAQIGNAQVEGAVLGSPSITFKPGKVIAGNYRFAIGTAGSTTLVLQTILPALLLASSPSTIVLEGGTHNPHAPPFDFLQKVFFPLINRMGPQVVATLECAGFYPAGGGKWSVTIEPAQKLGKLELIDRGEIVRRSARGIVSNISKQIARRELSVVAEKLGWAADCLHIEEVRSPGPGNILMLELESSGLTEIFTGFGERGVSSEHIAERVVNKVRDYLASGVPVGEYLADQLLLPMAMAGSGCFKTARLSRHSTTNIGVIQQFLAVQIDCHPKDQNCMLTVRSAEI
ncbi:MAG: rtcA [Verrucomicrobiales bacterium]|nr:rtcA [Verrucomicrobiales bacterium]